MNDLLAIMHAKCAAPPTEHPQPRGHNWKHCNDARYERMCNEVHAALRKLGRPATRTEIAKARGKNIDQRGLANVRGLNITIGKVRGRAAWFYWFAEETP